jgi:hypothetical protein
MGQQSVAEMSDGTAECSRDEWWDSSVVEMSGGTAECGRDEWRDIRV